MEVVHVAGVQWQAAADHVQSESNCAMAQDGRVGPSALSQCDHGPLGHC